MSVADANAEAVTISAMPGASAAVLIRGAACQHLATGNAEGLRWLCTHPATPHAMLAELAKVKEVKFARDTRSLAVENLSRR